MKKLYFLFFLTIGFLGNAQIVNIPDANFKYRLLSANTSNIIAQNLSGNNFKIDSNYDGEIQVSEALQVKRLYVAPIYASDPDINDLTGIEAFTNLEYLECSNNQLTNLNISQNTRLKELKCGTNNLTSLNLSNNILLFWLDCGNNQLNSLNLPQNNLLTNLYCNDNQLNNLDLTLNSLLTILRCENNQLNNLDVSTNPTLTELHCYNNLLSNLDVSTNSTLTKLYCYNNFLSNLDVSLNYSLNDLDCSDNVLQTLNIKNGNSQSWFNINFIYNPQLRYICADEEDINLIQGNIGGALPFVNSYCTFTPGGIFYEISGNTKFDFNNDGCDITDFYYKNLAFSISDGNNLSSMISNQTGNYYIPVGTGVFTITPTLENPTYFNISPTSFTANFPTQASPFTQDFCVTANGVKSDVEVVLIPSTPARPGFDATYKLVYHNKGNQLENGSVSLTFDDARLDYVAANPVYNSSAVNNFTWNYSNLQPFESREIGIVFNVNSPMEIPAVNNGEVMNYTTTITTANTDETPLDNTFTLDQTVVGSYDPNDKKCLQGTTITPTEVGKYVHYVIRFENTGTFPAENIVVKDMIDLAKFDIATLVPLKSSHDFFTRIKGNKVEFIFENINLDFNNATNDGYVVFKIKTKPTLVVGNTFTNNANIYFDYNFPITTNTYTTTVAALSNQDFDFETYFTLYPNPTKDVLNMQTKQSLAINSVEIYNQLGQIVMATTNAINSVDVANLASGTYFVKVNTEKGSANAKFVKE